MEWHLFEWMLARWKQMRVPGHDEIQINLTKSQNAAVAAVCCLLSCDCLNCVYNKTYSIERRMRSSCTTADPLTVVLSSSPSAVEPFPEREEDPNVLLRRSTSSARVWIQHLVKRTLY